MSTSLNYAGRETVTPETPAARRTKDAALLAGSLLVVWLGVLIAAPVALLGHGLAALLIARRRWGLAAVHAALSPVVVAFIAGVVTYVTGTARLQGTGLPGTEFHNLDPATRCGRSTSGCLVTGAEWLTHGPNNAAVRTMCAVFGAPPGAYAGPYPTAAEAKRALASAVPVSDALLATDLVDAVSPPLKLDPGVGAGLLRGTPIDSYLAWTKTGQDASWMLAEIGGPVTGTVWREQCLVLRIPYSPTTARIALVDVATGRPFAYYAEGDYYHRFPPVTWER